ncbi:hypothetical protein [Aporhodopirellula aestuarii]|uniref:Secreted protein n=1 Tax=Aporhodopirellula aestuarii TaxID=2950107 RepID=A0ABT0U9T2_9BACT|nr:hypothetical protein [Aporhodopirellula aestuarii]MCM2373702.1 hypothetical protein [Aporhodopirellula aestuarii]
MSIPLRWLYSTVNSVVVPPLVVMSCLAMSLADGAKTSALIAEAVLRRPAVLTVLVAADTGVTVDRIACLTSSTVASGSAAQIRAAVPAT